MKYHKYATVGTNPEEEEGIITSILKLSVPPGITSLNT